MKTMSHVALVACLLAAPAHARTRPVAYDDYYAIRSVSSTALAPDGSTVAYIESVVDEGENRTRSKLHLVATDGQSTPVRAVPPAENPPAGPHQRDEHSYSRADLWTVDLDGDVNTRLTNDEFNGGGPVWVSDYAVADIPRTKETEFYGTPWEEEGLRNLLASSPVAAGGVSTPTLFVHGESDHRVPIEEAEQMYVALKKQLVPVKMIRYPDSYHGEWTPWRYVHRLYSTLEWWEQWLGEKPIS